MRVFTWLSRSVLALLSAALLIAGVIAGVTPRVWRILNAHEQVPLELPDFAPLSQRSVAYDSANNVIGVYERENSQPVKLERVPEAVIKAFYAVEDEHFTSHNGFDLRGFTRAMLSNVSSDAPLQGASTITQQVVKNEFLAGLPRDARYKLLQAKYAMSLERKLTKGQILERYLSTVYFGNNAYGLAAAAEVYFGIDVSKLDLYQGAFLAGMVRSPSGFDPIRRPERARARWRQVMSRLADVRMLTREDATEKAEKWPMPETTRELPGMAKIAPTYFSEAMRRFLIERSTILGNSEQERASLLYRGGLRIHTTLDPKAQAAAEAARAVLPMNSKGFDTAIVSLDVRTAAVRAMVGGPGFKPVTSEVNMALKPRQTGSSIKLFILAAAIQAGAQPDDLIDGRKPCTLPSEKNKPFVIEDGASGFLGPLRDQTTKSINCAFSRLAQIVGLNRVVDTTYRMAHSAYLNRQIAPNVRRPLQPYASFATGANEMAPIDMASGMQTLANGGVHQDPHYVTRIDRADGTNLYTWNEPGVPVLDKGVALTTIDIMKGVLRTGTARGALRNFPRPAAGKTGTQDKNTNSWFVGATPELATAVWVGNPNGYVPMVNVPEFVKVGVRKVQGGTFPAKIWGAMMNAALDGAPKSDWEAPPPMPRGPKRLYLPGNECLARASGRAPASTQPPGFVARAPKTTVAPPPPPATTVAPGPGPTSKPGAKPGPAKPRPTRPRVVYRPLNGGTTIPPNILDPRWPLPSVDLNLYVYVCGSAPR